MQVATRGTMYAAMWTYMLRQLLYMLVRVLACQRRDTSESFGEGVVPEPLWIHASLIYRLLMRTDHAVCYLQTLPCYPPATRQRLERRGLTCLAASATGSPLPGRATQVRRQAGLLQHAVWSCRCRALRLAYLCVRWPERHPAMQAVLCLQDA